MEASGGSICVAGSGNEARRTGKRIRKGASCHTSIGKISEAGLALYLSASSLADEICRGLRAAATKNKDTNDCKHQHRGPVCK